MNSLRIVLVMAEPPLPFGNAAARWYYVLLKELTARGHRVTAYATCSKVSDIEEAKRLFSPPTYDLRLFPLPVRRSLRAKWESFRKPRSYVYGDDLKTSLAETLRSGCDVFHLEQLASGWIALDSLDHAFVNVHFLSRIDLESESPSTIRQWIDRWVALSGERRLLKRLRHVLCVSPRLAAEIRETNRTAEIDVIPIGLDSALYEYVADGARSKDLIVGLTGSMQWRPSSSAAKRLLTRLWPRIHAQVPEARVQIAGWDARSVLKAHLGDPGVTIDENVSDMRTYFERMTAMLYAPVHGSGMKVKVLEALAYGIPVVTTSEGIEGLPAADGVHAGIADDDDGLVERTVRLLRDVDAQNRQRAAGRMLLESCCGPKPTVDALEKVYDRFLRKGADPSRTT